MYIRARIIAVVACVAAVLAGCSAAGSSSGMVLHWYAGPDRVDVDDLAKSCTQNAGGKYTIEVEQLPHDQSARRTVLLKRLLGDDTSMDIISLDDAFTAEFAEAQVLAPVPEDLTAAVAEDDFDTAIEAASYDGNLVAVPWWLDPLVLWFRPGAAEDAGFSMEEPLTWDELFDGAERIGTGVQIDDPRGQGITPLVRGLVAQAGGSLIDGKTRDARVGLSHADEAASVLQRFHRDGLDVGDADKAHADRDAAESFAAPTGGFMVGPVSAISDPALGAVAADVDWAPMPALGDEQAAPLSGYHLAVPLYAQHSRESYEAIECLTSQRLMVAMMTSSGHSSASKAAYEEAGEDYPWSDVTRDAVENGVTAPSTPYWHLVDDGIRQTWMPLSDIDESSPAAAQRRVEALLAGEP